MNKTRLNKIKNRKREITREQVERLGFKFKRCHDSVYQKRYGMPYEIVSYKISKKLTIYWHAELKEAELLRIKPECGTVVGRLKINDPLSLKALISFYGEPAK
jgi:hypothetical protein